MSSAPLSPTAAAIPLRELLGEFEVFAAAHAVTLDHHHPTLVQTWNEITQAATDLGILNTGALLTKLPAVLAHLTGQKNVTGYPALAVRDQLHLYRNTAITVILAAAAMVGVDTRPVLACIPRLKQRSQSRDRPLTDDEITLLRVLAAIRIADLSTSQGATVFALCDAGLTPTETTQVTGADIDDSPECPLVQAAGHHQGLNARLLPLEEFHTAILAERMSQDPARRPRDTLSYCPRTNKPGSAAAAASVSGIMSRFMDAVQINEGDVSPASPRAWRIRHTWFIEGPEAATEKSGRDLDATARLADIRSEIAQDVTPVEAF
ncbi:hypothetical protein [Cellulomonas sp. P24]|uniref:hypothetical protein n=1 Tax=Cellulomonas sp. P24 TaxID=2885206 RepID=UPI00216AE00F|nr:hypothetical protein [Cellulomonas sp. P24]MCR6491435.1 hypothetical protein [Cellulomonas sp. P24]